MAFTAVPDDDDIFRVVRAYLLTLIDSAVVDVVLAQVNRIPEPKKVNYIKMTPARRIRLSTNKDTYRDASYLGSIAGTVLTVTEILTGAILAGFPLWGTGVANNTSIVSLGTGTGGIGTYNVDVSQTLTSRKLASGSKVIEEDIELTLQLDIHGAEGANVAQVVLALFNDASCYAAFEALSTNVRPLYATDPRQVPFVDGEMQYEDRWVLELVLQVNTTVVNTQQFADALEAEVINVEASYPAQ
jgi:hypothetical protein